MAGGPSTETTASLQRRPRTPRSRGPTLRARSTARPNRFRLPGIGTAVVARLGEPGLLLAHAVKNCDELELLRRTHDGCHRVRDDPPHVVRFCEPSNAAYRFQHLGRNLKRFHLR